MSGRSLFLVAYDVRNARRLRRIHKKLQGFGQALQFSVFQCELTQTEKQLLLGAVSEIIHHKEDRVLIVNMGRRKGRADRVIETLGRQELPPERARSSSDPRCSRHPTEPCLRKVLCERSSAAANPGQRSKPQAL